MKRATVALLCVLLAACVCLASCGKTPIGARELLEEMMAVGGELPDGVLYDSAAEEGSDGYCSASLRQYLYGEAAEETFALVEEYAVYVSSFILPIEMAVFRCYSATDAHRVEAMCLNRGETLRIALRGTELEALSDSVRVLCRGRYVVMILAENAEAVEDTALKFMGK